jgi:hypothetical protein
MEQSLASKLFHIYGIPTIKNVDFRVMYPGIYMIIHGGFFGFQTLAHICNTLHQECRLQGNVSWDIPGYSWSNL